ncbi:MAG TPA: HAMP domain-containing sensor histidine kinase [Phototrophicaceae bacterium]|nr:HAMP domain-containing sensor histidine kinase [Phototrophicaceae bacterium]
MVVIAILSVNFSLAFLLTGWVYAQLHLSLPPLVMQVFNSIGGLVITGLLVTATTRWFRPQITDGENRVYGPIIDALQRIAKGDFSVRVDSAFGQRAPSQRVLGELVNSVNQMAAELNQMETLRQEFISNVSHEIQSPLTSIRGFAQALQNDHLSADERQRYLLIIEAESTRLSRLTDNLLKLAALEGEQVKFEPKTYRLDKQIRNLILACEPQWTAKALEIDAALDPVEITADEDLLSQVWINLIHNSVKFTPERGKISAELQQQDHQIQFRITDTGPGIAPEDQSRIFERFYKADKSRTHATNGGSGLGLAIVQKIIELHHGTVTIRSEPGQGATFTVLLPPP